MTGSGRIGKTDELRHVPRRTEHQRPKLRITTEELLVLVENEELRIDEGTGPDEFHMTVELCETKNLSIEELEELYP